MKAADGTTFQPGDRMFNYYDRKPGTVGADGSRDGWFTFEHEDGTSALLNGERVGSIAHARGDKARPRGAASPPPPAPAPSTAPPAPPPRGPPLEVPAAARAGAPG